MQSLQVFKHKGFFFWFFFSLSHLTHIRAAPAQIPGPPTEIHLHFRPNLTNGGQGHPLPYGPNRPSSHPIWALTRPSPSLPLGFIHPPQFQGIWAPGQSRTTPTPPGATTLPSHLTISSLPSTSSVSTQTQPTCTHSVTQWSTQTDLTFTPQVFRFPLFSTGPPPPKRLTSLPLRDSILRVLQLPEYSR